MYYELTFCGKVYLNLLTYIISCQKSQLTTIFTEKKNTMKNQNENKNKKPQQQQQTLKGRGICYQSC